VVGRNRVGKKNRAKVQLAALSLVIVLLLALVVGTDVRLNQVGAGVKVVKVGVIGSSDDQIWKAVQAELDQRGEHIRIELKPFQDAIYVNQATSNREVDFNAAQHYAYLEDDVKTNHYQLAVLGNTYISPMFWLTVSFLKAAGASMIEPILLSIRLFLPIVCPISLMLPFCMGDSPVIRRIRVVLPAPFSPISP